MRYIFVSIFAALLLSLCIVDDIFVHKTFNALEATTTQLSAQLSADNTETAKTLAKEIEDYWHKKQKPMALFIHHEETKIVGDKVTLIKHYLNEDMKNEAGVQVSALLYEISTLRKQYRLNFANVF